MHHLVLALVPLVPVLVSFVSFVRLLVPLVGLCVPKNGGFLSSPD